MNDTLILVFCEENNFVKKKKMKFYFLAVFFAFSLKKMLKKTKEKGNISFSFFIKKILHLFLHFFQILFFSSFVTGIFRIFVLRVQQEPSLTSSSVHRRELRDRGGASWDRRRE